MVLLNVKHVEKNPCVKELRLEGGVNRVFFVYNFRPTVDIKGQDVNQRTKHSLSRFLTLRSDGMRKHKKGEVLFSVVDGDLKHSCI